jgi:hypothetical protein
MAGTATVPSVAGGQTFNLVTLHWIDDNEKEYSHSFRTIDAPTDPQLQAFVDDSQALSNASSWRLEVTNIYEGAKDAGNAASAVHESVADKVRLSYKDISTGAYEQAYIPAPLEDVILDNNTVDITDALYIAWKAAVDAIKQTGMTALNVAFVQYQQRNDSVSP